MFFLFPLMNKWVNEKGYFLNLTALVQKEGRDFIPKILVSYFQFKFIFKLLNLIIFPASPV